MDIIFNILKVSFLFTFILFSSFFLGQKLPILISDYGATKKRITMTLSTILIGVLMALVLYVVCIGFFWNTDVLIFSITITLLLVGTLILSILFSQKEYGLIMTQSFPLPNAFKNIHLTASVNKFVIEHSKGKTKQENDHLINGIISEAFKTLKKHNIPSGNYKMESHLLWDQKRRDNIESILKELNAIIIVNERSSKSTELIGNITKTLLTGKYKPKHHWFKIEFKIQHSN
ncbi:hypothetical protein KDD30_20205 (plasmid) [Photobacterium sp. GJ3]|uniref:hypothetical protein n=1 Tax=Photobacterium sp. GJ3 TaxID=2829502 RepID=UPI001B8D73A5|nr:hypothetical protein [Photobacterium sp. GJ3]QUJ70425.1 hypothetical protein KDD30_20205 [Photobacterium sp. GJ3]